MFRSFRFLLCALTLLGATSTLSARPQNPTFTKPSRAPAPASAPTAAPAPAPASAAALAPASDPIPAPAPAAEPLAAYLLVYFTGVGSAGEQIYFAVSEDGLRWRDLNNSEPVLLSTLGEKGVRDPAIIRSADGKKFHILATDLRIASKKGWGVATTSGSTSLIIWESPDLVNWSKPWSADVASKIPEAGCAWAPEAIFDETTQDYFVYWATISPRNGAREARVYWSRTKDFRTFTSPELYIERVLPNGKTHPIIDTQIIRVEDGKHRFYRASGDGQITIEGADSLLGEWQRIGDVAHLGYTGKQVEGPILFQFNGERKWGMLADQYASGRGYLPFVLTDPANTRSYRVLAPSEYSLGASRKRHGSVLNITRPEYEALLARWPSLPSTRLASLDQPERFVRHANYRLRLDAEVHPEADALWRFAPGLSGASNTVSLRAVNVSDHYLVVTPDGLALAADKGDADLRARATFIRVPGLADTAALSLKLSGAGERYLLAQGSDLVVAPVRSDADRRAATFRERN